MGYKNEEPKDFKKLIIFDEANIIDEEQNMKDLVFPSSHYRCPGISHFATAMRDVIEHERNEAENKKAQIPYLDSCSSMIPLFNFSEDLRISGLLKWAKKTDNPRSIKLSQKKRKRKISNKSKRKNRRNNGK